jgi:drug/metabolite transporter (DMT)-like permease
MAKPIEKSESTSNFSLTRWGVTAGLLGAAFFSCKAIIVKLAYGHGVDAVTLIALRMAVALPFFAVAAAWVHWKTPSSESPWRKGDVRKVVLLGGVGYYAASFLDFLGLQFISAGLERILLYLTPTIVVLISCIWLKKSISNRQKFALLISYTGVVVVFFNDVSFVASQAAKHSGISAVLIGAALVLASAICYAIYLTASGELVKRLGVIRLTAWASLVSSGLCFIQALLISPGAIFSQPLAVYNLSVLNGVFCTVVPVYLTMLCVEKLGSSVASQLGIVGPVVTIFLAAWLLKEPITALQLVGSTIVIIGVFVLTSDSSLGRQHSVQTKLLNETRK